MSSMSSTSSGTGSQRQKYGVRGGRQESVISTPPHVFSMAGDDQQCLATNYDAKRHPSSQSVSTNNTASTTVCTATNTVCTPLPPIEDSIHRPKGLRNVGNTCYANAVLQCLLSTALTHALIDPQAGAIFRRYSSNPNLLKESLRESSSSEQEERDDEKSERRRRRQNKQLRDKCKWLTRELRAITVEFHLCEDSQRSNNLNGAQGDWMTLLSMGSWLNGPIVDPGAITKHPDRLSTCLRPYQQEDAHEFLRALLSTLVMNGQNKKLSSLFDGLLESSVTCEQCGRPSNTRDRYMDLSLDINQPHVKTLTDAMRDFTSSELLDGDNCVFCQRCRKKQPAKKALRLATAPSILVCHLKRFALDEYGRLQRVNKQVHFSERLQIGNYMSKVNKSKPPPYELVALLVHQGSSCDSGHYIAFSKHAGEWYSCNDSVVERVDIKTVLAQQAYILMYEVADMRENHGYPSPHTPKTRKANEEPSASSAFSVLLSSNLLCGVDETSLRNFCCYDSVFSTAESASPVRRRGRTPRDDSTLEESTVKTNSSSRRMRLRRTSSSGTFKNRQRHNRRQRGSSARRDISITRSSHSSKKWSSERFSEHRRRSSERVITRAFSDCD